MRIGPVLATAATAAALVAASAPAALAGVSPNPVSPGHTVTISDDGRCGREAREATASSPLFGEVHLDRHGGDHLTGTARISRDAEPGSYKVTVRCDGRWGKEFTDWLRVHGRPHGGAHAGLGGASGSHTAELAGGAALIALAGGGAYAATRRRRRHGV